MIQTRARSALAMVLWPIALTAALLAGPLAGVGSCDNWLPFSGMRVVSPSGRKYVVIRQKGRGIMSFELCERRPSAPPMKSAFIDPLMDFILEENDPVDIDRDPEDTLLASGEVNHLPMDAMVLECGAFVLIGIHGPFGGYKDITYVNEQGKVGFQRSLWDLYGGVPKGSWSTISSTWWLNEYWLDQDRRSVVVVSLGAEPREVALADGKVTVPDYRQILAWCRTGLPEDRAKAMDVACRMAHPAGDIDPTPEQEPLRRERMDLLVPLAREIAASPEDPIGVRLRAALFLVRSKRVERPEAYGSLFLEGIGKGNTEDDRGYAAEHLPDVLGIKALPALRGAMRGKTEISFRRLCERALVRLGEPALPALIEMVLETGESSSYRGGAASALWEIKSPRAVPALLEAAATGDRHLARIVIGALITCGKDDPALADKLIGLLMKGTNSDESIVRHFNEAPTPRAIPALEKALERASREKDYGQETARLIAAAIAACRATPPAKQ